MIETLMKLFKKQFTRVVNAFGVDKKVEVLEERSFNLLGSVDVDTIYVVIHFQNGTLMLGGTILPIQIEVFSSVDDFDFDYNMLFTYALNFNYNVPSIENVFIQQVYTTPEVSSAFNQDNGEYKALFTMNGTIVYGEQINGISNIKINNTNVLYTSVKVGIDSTPNSANLGANNSRVNSIMKFATASFVVNCVSLQSEIIELIDKIMLGSESINTIFTIEITKNGTVYTKSMKLLGSDYQQAQGGIPTYVLSFVE